MEEPATHLRRFTLRGACILALCAAITAAEAFVILHSPLTGWVHASSVQERSAPARLAIPTLGIDVSLTNVGVTADGTMEVPEYADEIGWYRHGAKPGEAGTALFAGHRDAADGSPGVFWNLHTLVPGNVITVTDTTGILLTFVISRTQVIDGATRDLPGIIGESATPRIALITCHGAWSQTAGEYDRRFLVIADLVPREE